MTRGFWHSFKDEPLGFEGRGAGREQGRGPGGPRAIWRAHVLAGSFWRAGFLARSPLWRAGLPARILAAGVPQKRRAKQAFLYFAALAAVLLLPVACKKNNLSPKTANAPTRPVPVCNADSCMKFAEAQLAFGPRTPGSQAQKKCATYLQAQLQRLGAETQIQEFTAKRWDGTALNGYNIIGSIHPKTPNRILLCAHWDSRPYADNDENPDHHHKAIDGANDGASGVAVLLEVARILQQQAAEDNRPQTGIDIIFFDLEDSGKPHWAPDAYGDELTWCLGSQYWSENPHTPGYQAMYGILLDMVGTENPCFTMEATSMYFAPDVMRHVWNKAARMGYTEVFRGAQTGALIDDHLFINRATGIPVIDIVHYDRITGSGFFPHWHTVNDNLANLSPATMKIVGDVVLSMVLE